MSIRRLLSVEAVKYFSICSKYNSKQQKCDITSTVTGFVPKSQFENSISQILRKFQDECTILAGFKDKT